MKKLLKNFYGFHIKLIKSDSGYSSKAFIMVGGFYLAALVTVTMTVLTILDFNKTGELDYTGVSWLLGALASLILASAYGKAKSDTAYWDSQSPPDLPTANGTPNINL